MNEELPPTATTADRSLETLCHLLAFCGLAIPFGNVLGPLALWLWKREENPAVNLHGKEVLNFQICLSIYLMLAALSFMVLVGIVLFPLVLIMGVVSTVIGAVQASQGRFFRYPLTYRFLA